MKVTLVRDGEEMTIDMLKSTIYIASRPYEGIGMSFLEAMADGRCVVAHDNTTHNEYIEHGKNGFLFDMEEDIIITATSRKKNIIYVGTLRDTDFAKNFIVKHAKDQGYRVKIYAMAVHPIESLISTQERYER